MGIDNYITDPKTHKNAHVVHINEDDKNVDFINKNALVVATHPLKIYENSIQFFTSSTYGIDMNIGRTVDNTENVNDGTDNAYWTATAIVGGKWTIDSTDQNHTALGTKSIKYDNGNINDILQITKGSDFTATGYNDLIIWIYVDKDWKIGDSIVVYGWDTGAGVMVGNSTPLEDYFSFNVYDVWHKITIPLSDMTLTGETLDAIRIEIIAEEGKSPKMYLDDIAFEGTDDEPGAGEFIIKPELGTWLHVHSFSYIIADDSFDSTIDGGVDNVTSPTLPNIPYNTLLGVAALSSGILYQRVVNEEVQFSVTIKQISDILQLAGAKVVSQGSAGTTGTWITIKNEILEPIILKAENQDKLKFVVNDNLSGLDLLRITADCKIEKRQ